MYKECLDFLILVHSITFYLYNDAANSTLITAINYIVQYMHIYKTAIIKGQKMLHYCDFMYSLGVQNRLISLQCVIDKTERLNQ